VRQRADRPRLEAVDASGAGGQAARDRLAGDLHGQAHVAKDLAELLVVPPCRIPDGARMDAPREIRRVADGPALPRIWPQTQHDEHGYLKLGWTCFSKPSRLSKTHASPWRQQAGPRSPPRFSRPLWLCGNRSLGSDTDIRSRRHAPRHSA